MLIETKEQKICLNLFPHGKYGHPKILNDANTFKNPPIHVNFKDYKNHSIVGLQPVFQTEILFPFENCIDNKDKYV